MASIGDIPVIGQAAQASVENFRQLLNQSVIFPRARANVFNSTVYEILNAPSCSITRTTGQSIANGGAVASFDTAEWDTDGFFTTGSPTRVTVRTTGRYDVKAQVVWTGAVGGVYRGAWLYKNGVTTTRISQDLRTAANQDMNAAIADTLTLAAGDYLEIFCYQDTGGALSTKVNVNQPASQLKLTLLSSV